MGICPAHILLPDPEIQVDEAMGLRGEVPGPINLPHGYFLSYRCPLVTKECNSFHPELEPVDNRFVPCFESKKMQDVVQLSSRFEDFDRAFDVSMAQWSADFQGAGSH